VAPGGEARPLPSWLARLAAARATGALVAVSGDARREILLTNGEVRAARSDVEDEKLGMWLVERGRISEDDRALNLLAQGGGVSPPLGHFLVTRGHLSAEDLEDELQELALTIIRRAAAAPRTRCSFVDGGGTGQLDTLPNVVTSQIVLLAARNCADIEAIRREIGSQQQRVRLSASFKDLLEEIELTPTEGFLLSRLDAAKDLAGLVRLSSLPEPQLYSSLFVLVLSGAVVLEGGVSEAPDLPEEETPSLEDGSADTDQPVEAAIGEKGDFSERQIEERKYIRKLSEAVTKVDHYRALGLKPEANPAEIAEAWKQMQARFAPEAAARPHLRDMVTHLERIVERARGAYEVLSDYKARERYDRILKSVDKERTSIATSGRGEVDPKARKELVEANLKRANELIREKEFYLAIQLLERACALDPRPDELLKLARLLQRNPLWTNRALACLRRAIETDPKHVESWLELADFWRRRNHAERQRKSLERALAVDPDNETANRMYKDLAGAKELQRLLRRARQMR
jgi:tetratricopeptide (TPR) repeat protein